VSSAPPAEFERLLPLEGGFNLRDLGGYETGEGGRVKRGMLYRSGTMSKLTDADERHLTSLGIATVCDFRRSDERASEPTRWCEPAGVHYWAHDYTESSGVLGDVIRSVDATAADMRAAMIKTYRTIPIDHAPSYRVTFERLLGGHVPLLFNCAVGKDRTGVFAALILHALGVPRATIVEDYLLTNVHADISRLIAGREPPAYMANRSLDVFGPLMAADADYLAAMFDGFDSDFGGIDGYLAAKLGVDQDAQMKLRALLVE
jgi:protein-tyrosine phosphatase